jgi:hypothetical protein
MRSHLVLAGCILALAALSGCGSPPPDEGKQTPGSSSMAPTNHESGAASNAVVGESTEADTGELASLSTLEEEQRKAKAEHLKDPKDSKARATYVKMTNSLANATMLAESLPPKVKYVRALKLFHESLEADPQNGEAKKWIKEIEDIYKSLGRPVPKV